MTSSMVNSMIQQFDETQSDMQPAVVMHQLDASKYVQNFEIYS